MDPASAVVGIVSFGFTVLGKINEVRKAIKGAPRSVQDLKDSCALVELTLEKLKSIETHVVPQSTAELSYLGLLRDNAQRGLKEVEEAVDKVLVSESNGNNGSGLPKLYVRKFILNKNNFEEFSRKVKELQNALDRMLSFSQT